VKRRIQVRITPAGDLSVEAQGFQGRGCQAATQALEEALGQARKRRKKPSFWQRLQGRQQKLGGGGG
jgi:hypothetical protein